MSNFRSRLARYNTVCCEQVMPVPVIPICAISMCLPRPICEIKNPECFILIDPSQLCGPPVPPQACNPPQSAIENAPLEAPIQPINNQIPTYCPGLPDPPSGTFLTTSSFVIPPGYLLLDGSSNNGIPVLSTICSVIVILNFLKICLFLLFLFQN